ANPEHLRTRRLNMNFGDWLSIDADTPKEVLATAYYALDAQLMARVAGVLAKQDDVELYEQLFADIKAAFIDAYVSADGRVFGDTQTCYLLALHAGLLPEELRAPAAARLVDDIAARGGHLSTGFLGVGYLAPILSDSGYLDVAYRLALSETYPSWGYSISHGATTIWERWDGWTEEHGFQTPEMNSFNHYAFGSIGEWLYRYVAGIDLDPLLPGFRHVVLRPQPGGGLTHAEATYRSVRGKIHSHWTIDGDRLAYQLTIPANTTATLHLPAADPDNVRESGIQADTAPGVKRVVGAGDAAVAVFELASGAYEFESVVTGPELGHRE
ncbi:MAG TPA: alpha-L-rhamnosidase C-terminal domain-containing protein, partial [Trueperaceae bacterium]|nr:alpha-L-rhamnosidase C-terminal domain-containing protein [Trueperaceae bacterium]